VERDHPFVEGTLRALRKVGHEPEVGYWQFGTDGSMSAGLMGIPTIGYSGAEERYAHTSDEQANVEMLLESLEGYYAILCELFGVEFLA
jgi:acetylornithine deacetylase/succinyl-diaminopimelate desuccinylase-like protein